MNRIVIDTEHTVHSFPTTPEWGLAVTRAITNLAVNSIVRSTRGRAVVVPAPSDGRAWEVWQ